MEISEEEIKDKLASESKRRQWLVDFVATFIFKPVLYLVGLTLMLALYYRVYTFLKPYGLFALVIGFIATTYLIFHLCFFLGEVFSKLIRG